MKDNIWTPGSIPFSFQLLPSCPKLLMTKLRSAKHACLLLLCITRSFIFRTFADYHLYHCNFVGSSAFTQHDTHSSLPVRHIDSENNQVAVLCAGNGVLAALILADTSTASTLLQMSNWQLYNTQAATLSGYTLTYDSH